MGPARRQSARGARPLVALLLAILLGSCVTILRSTPTSARGTLTLTFDDGPNPGVTDALLDVLARHDVRAYFCLIGENVEATPEHQRLARRIRDEGHVIVNHGQRAHWAALHVDTRSTRDDITRADATFRRVLGDDFETRWYRPGGGWVWLWQRSAARLEGKSVLTLDRYDWDALTAADTAEAHLERLLDAAERGDLGRIVIHDGLNDADTARAGVGRADRSFVPDLVERLIVEARARGLEVREAQADPARDGG